MKNVKFGVILGVIALGLCSYFGTFFMCVATINYFLILNGFFMRKKNRAWHVGLISLGILLDLVLVLTLEIQRDAIATAVSFKLSPLNQAHIYCSSVATLLYFPMIFTGLMIIKKEKYRTWHQRFGYLVICFRSLGFVLMFSMLKSLHNV